MLRPEMAVLPMVIPFPAVYRTASNVDSTLIITSFS